MKHELKLWPEYFQSIIDGTKPWELRRNDRDFKVGDILLLREYVPDTNQYTGRECERKITGVFSNLPMVASFYCVLSLETT